MALVLEVRVGGFLANAFSLPLVVSDRVNVFVKTKKKTRFALDWSRFVYLIMEYLLISNFWSFNGVSLIHDYRVCCMHARC